MKYIASIVLLASILLALNLPTAKQESVRFKPSYTLVPIPSRHANDPHRPIAESTSGNWSGYAAAGSVFTEVEGSWKVPSLTGINGKRTYCSMWVGLDGYNNNTVEQLGTEHDWTSSGQQQNYAWFEMYPAYSYKIQGFTVNVGDIISASVKYVGNGVFTLAIINETRGLSYIVPPSYTTSPGAALTSAEWIMEAPSSRAGPLPLSNFGTAYFFNCVATLNGITTGPIDNGWFYDPLTMLDPKGGKSYPSVLTDTPNGSSFSVQFSK